MSAARLAKLARIEKALNRLHAPPPVNASPSILFVHILRDPGRPIKGATAFRDSGHEGSLDVGFWEPEENEPEAAFLDRITVAIATLAPGASVTCLLRHCTVYDDPLSPDAPETVETGTKPAPEPAPAPAPAPAPLPVPVRPVPAEPEPAPSRFVVSGDLDRSMSR